MGTYVKQGDGAFADQLTPSLSVASRYVLFKSSPDLFRFLFFSFRQDAG